MTPPEVTVDWLVSADLAPDAGDPALAALYEAAARGELALPFCGSCGLPLELEQRVCDGCDATDVRWRPVEPVGTVHAATAVHRREPGLILTGDPYPVLDVEVGSGHRLVMTTTGPVTDLPAIGQSVTISFRSVGGVAVPAAHVTDARSTEKELAS
jgi:uncharacterized OB-fold protein